MVQDHPNPARQAKLRRSAIFIATTPRYDLSKPRRGGTAGIIQPCAAPTGLETVLLRLCAIQMALLRSLSFGVA